MKKFFLILSAILAFTACSAQYVINGRLQIKSGTGLNSIIGGSDTIYYGWDAHKFSFFDKDTNKILEFGLSDTAKFYSNLKFSSAYTNGTIYWPNSNNSYIKGNALYFLHGSEFLQAIPTQLKISASTHNYATLNSYRLLFNKAAGVFIQNDTNGVLMYGSDYAVRDEQGNRYLKHTYSDSSTTIFNKLIVESPTDTAIKVNGDVLATSYYFNSYLNSYLTGTELYIEESDKYWIDINTFNGGSSIAVQGDTLRSDLLPNSLHLANKSDNTYLTNRMFDVSMSRNFLFRENQTNHRFLFFNTVDSSTTIYNRLNVESPTDTAVVIDGNVSADKIYLSQSIQVGNDATAASAANVGAIRYRSDANNSYCEMVMQTGASSYAWVIIKQNTW